MTIVPYLHHVVTAIMPNLHHVVVAIMHHMHHVVIIIILHHHHVVMAVVRRGGHGGKGDRKRGHGRDGERLDQGRLLFAPIERMPCYCLRVSEPGMNHTLTCINAYPAYAGAP